MKYYQGMIQLIFVSLSIMLCSGCSSSSERAVLTRVEYGDCFYAQLNTGVEVIVNDNCGYELKLGMVVQLEQYTHHKSGNRYWRIKRVVALPK